MNQQNDHDLQEVTLTGLMESIKHLSPDTDKGVYDLLHGQVMVQQDYIYTIKDMLWKKQAERAAYLAAINDRK